MVVQHQTSLKMAEIRAMIRKQQSKLVDHLAKKSHFSILEVGKKLRVCSRAIKVVFY